MSSATENQAQKRAHAEKNGDDAVDAKSRKVENGQGKSELAFNMITTPEIICDLFSFLDKDQIERIQLVNQFWNNVIIRHKNILPYRKLYRLDFGPNEIHLYVTEKDVSKFRISYAITFDGSNLSNIEVSSRYSQLTVDEVLANLNNVVYTRFLLGFDYIEDSEDFMELGVNNFLNMMKLITTKTGSIFRGRKVMCHEEIFGSKLVAIFDNYIIVDKLELIDYNSDSYIREVCANPEQLPSTPKEISLGCLEFEENEEVLNFTCNGKLNGANRLTIHFKTSNTNYGNFIRQWFELYRTHQNPIYLVRKFKISSHFNHVLDAVKTFLNNTQLRVKFSLERKEFDSYLDQNWINDHFQRFKRRCVLHETDSYALMVEMEFRAITDMSSINASDLDQPPCYTIKTISFCVKSL